LIKSRDADDRVIEEHYGSKLTRRIIERYQPRLCVHGHIEEGRGTDRIGKTAIVNVGEGRSGTYAVTKVDDDIGVVLGP
jgi:Icc-related predicted phosphoesterase